MGSQRIGHDWATEQKDQPPETINLANDFECLSLADGDRRFCWDEMVS